MGVQRAALPWRRAVLSVLLVGLAVREQAEAHKANGVRDVFGAIRVRADCVEAMRGTTDVRGVYITVHQVMIWAHSASAVGTLHATLRKTISYSRPVHLVRTTVSHTAGANRRWGSERL
jgi:branched-subunit amino acid ABC-type transport system permease component